MYAKIPYLPWLQLLQGTLMMMSHCLREKKCESLLRDSASAIVLSVPGRWQADRAILNIAAVRRCRQRIRAIVYESELVLALMIRTAAALAISMVGQYKAK